MNKLQQIASKATDPARKWETRHQSPVGKAQQEVLNALGLTANNHGHANNIFAEIGIVVSSRRDGRKSVPVVTKSYTGGGFNAYGEGEESFSNADGLDFSVISQWMN